MTYMNIDVVNGYLCSVFKFRTLPNFIINFELSEKWGEEVVSSDQVSTLMTEQQFREMQCKVPSLINLK